MLMPGRHYNADKYRFGFNGKEHDTEWKGSAGAIYDYGFRIYDPRIAKFLSVDPLTKSYPWYTPYQFAGNKPINCIDIDGLEEYFAVTPSGMKYLGKLGESTQLKIIKTQNKDAKNIKRKIKAINNNKVDKKSFDDSQFKDIVINNKESHIKLLENSTEREPFKEYGLYMTLDLSGEDAIITYDEEIAPPSNDGSNKTVKFTFDPNYPPDSVQDEDGYEGNDWEEGKYRFKNGKIVIGTVHSHNHDTGPTPSAYTRNNTSGGGGGYSYGDGLGATRTHVPWYTIGPNKTHKTIGSNGTSDIVKEINSNNNDLLKDALETKTGKF